MVPNPVLSKVSKVIMFWKALPKYGLAVTSFNIVDKMRTFIDANLSSEFDLESPIKKFSDKRQLAMNFTYLEDLIARSYPLASCCKAFPIIRTPLDGFGFQKNNDDDDDDDDGFLYNVELVPATIACGGCQNSQVRQKHSMVAYRSALLKTFNLDWFVLPDNKENCYKGQSDLAFKQLVYQPGQARAYQLKNCLSLRRLANNAFDFSNEANAIIKAAEQFAKDIGKKLIHFYDYIMKAAADNRIVDIINKAISNVAQAIKNIFLYIIEMGKKIATALNLMEDDATKKAQKVAESCATGTSDAARKLRSEADKLFNVNKSLSTVASIHANEDLNKASKRLAEISNSVRNQAEILQTQGQNALDFLRNLKP